MLTNLIEHRGKEFSNLIKLGDYLARTLRENVELFSVEDGQATYLTESGSVVTGNYSFKPTLKLSNIVVEDSSVLEDRKSFEAVVDKKVSTLLSNLMESDYGNAENTFDKVLSMFETKLSYERVKSRLEDKTARFGSQTNIIESSEFKRVVEVKDQIVKFLKESRETVESAAVRNGMKLAMLVSTSFDLPKKTVAQIQEEKVFEVRTASKASLYEHLCRKELIQKELLESKESFDRIWINNDKVHNLASMVFESDQDTIRHQVAEIVSDIPYFALATKKQLRSLISNSLAMVETKVADKDINSFVSIIFEMKAPVKKHVINILNEKYGIDVRKLDEVPTFRTLIMNESEILRSIARKAPKGSVVQRSLVELANSLVIKNGAESIDLADFLSEVFAEADYTDRLNETSLMSYLDFTKVADDLGKIGQVLKMLMPAVAGISQAGDQLDGLGMGDVAPDAGMEPEDPLGSPDPMSSDAEAPPPGMDAEQAAKDVQDELADEEAAADDGMEEPVADDIEEPAEEESPEMGDEEGEEGDLPPELAGAEGEMEDGMEGEEGEGEEEAPDMDSDELLSILSRLEDLLGDVKSDIGDDDGEDVDFEDEEGSEEPEEGSDEAPVEDEAPEEESEEDMPKKKEKKLSPEQYKS
jgi:hypothetical protein